MCQVEKTARRIGAASFSVEDLKKALCFLLPILLAAVLAPLLLRGRDVRNVVFGEEKWRGNQEYLDLDRPEDAGRNLRKGTHRPRLLRIKDVEEIVRNTRLRPEDSHFPEQTLRERIEALNRAIQRAGIQPEDLKIVAGVPEMLDDFWLDSMKLEELPLDEPVLLLVLKYTAGRTRLVFRYKPGLVVFADVKKLPPLPESEIPQTPQDPDVDPDADEDPFAPRH